MEQFERVKVVMLPTNEKAVNTKEYQLLLSNSLFWTSKIEIERYTEGWFFLKNSSSYNSCAITIPNVENFKHQHLYIISDDEITSKKLLNTNDYYYIRNHYNEWYVGKFNGVSFDFINNDGNFDSNLFVCKKIIATTNASLYREESCTGYTETRSRTFYSKKPLPKPSKQFIEKYVESYNKGNIITDVLVEYEDIIYNPEKEREYQSNDRINLEDCDKQSRLKINPKDNTITIKKVKDSYTREEHISNIKKFSLELGSKIHCFLKEDGTLSISIQDVNKWIEENL